MNDHVGEERFDDNVPVIAAPVRSFAPETREAVAVIGTSRTWISNGDEIAVAPPMSVTATWIGPIFPMSDVCGVPKNAPVVASNESHGGRVPEAIVNEYPPEPPETFRLPE